MNFEHFWKINKNAIAKKILNPGVVTNEEVRTHFQYCFHEGRAAGFLEAKKQQEKMGDEGVAEWREKEVDVDFAKEAQKDDSFDSAMSGAFEKIEGDRRI